MSSVRYANIGAGVAMIFLIVGVAFLKDAGDGALQALGLTAFFLGGAVYHGLDERARRRRSRGQ